MLNSRKGRRSRDRRATKLKILPRGARHKNLTSVRLSRLTLLRVRRESRTYFRDGALTELPRRPGGFTIPLMIDLNVSAEFPVTRQWAFLDHAAVAPPTERAR